MLYGRILSIIFTLLSFSGVGQGKVNVPSKINKGTFYIYWGWNRDNFTKSNLNFQGTDYNFTLSDVVAHDRQSKFSFNEYLNPTYLTIPQFNFRLGYNFSEHYSISFGDDHMKYVMDNNRVVKINGEIKTEDSTFNGSYNNADIKLTSDFLKFEHTDGLNYLNIELRRNDELYNLKKLHLTNIGLTLIEGIGLGALMPRTNTTLMNNKRYDEFHLAGYGLGAVLGVNIIFWDHFFIQSELKGGFIHMPDIRTTMNKSDRASQHFFFLQRNIVFGWAFKL